MASAQEGDVLQDATAAWSCSHALTEEFGAEDNDHEASPMLRRDVHAAAGYRGQTLRDSFHLGQTIANDYGRPYQPGFNTVDGLAGSGQFGRFSLYARAEYQHAPSGSGVFAGSHCNAVGHRRIPLASNPVQATIPSGPIPSANKLSHRGGESLVSPDEPSNIVWQERPLARADDRRQLSVQQQRRKHLRVSRLTASNHSTFRCFRA